MSAIFGTSDFTGAVYVNSGNVWSAGTGIQTLTSGNNLRVLFENPSGNTKSVTVSLFRGLADGPVFIDIFTNPTTGLPTTVKTIHPGVPTAFTYTGVVTFKADISGTALSGGTQMSTPIGLGSGAETQLVGSFPIPVNTTVGFNFTATGNTKMYFVLVWIEI